MTAELKVKRSFALSEDKIKELNEETKANGQLAIPYNKRGIYHGICKSLSNLGENEWHNFIDLKNELERIMSQIPTTKKGVDAWSLFTQRETRNPITGKDLFGKIIQNAKVLQRVYDVQSQRPNNNPYGLKLQQLCACIDIMEKDGEVKLRLNTNFDSFLVVKPIKLKGKNN